MILPVSTNPPPIIIVRHGQQLLLSDMVPFFLRNNRVWTNNGPSGVVITMPSTWNSRPVNHNHFIRPRTRSFPALVDQCPIVHAQIVSRRNNHLQIVTPRRIVGATEQVLVLLNSSISENTWLMVWLAYVKVIVPLPLGSPFRSQSVLLLTSRLKVSPEVFPYFLCNSSGAGLRAAAQECNFATDGITPSKVAAKIVHQTAP